MSTLLKAKSWVKWHNKLGWWSLAAMIIWVLSGASHPLMSWLGPRAESFYPPSMQLEPKHVEGLSDLLSSGLLPEGSRLVKVVPSRDEPLLQVTKSLSSPREYYSLSKQKAIPDYDRQQAKWLGTYYTGRAAEDIAEIRLITEFSSAYPWVNRLLPVYKIRYTGSDKLTAFIHTETAALASLNNKTKASMQWFFQNLHTFKFLDGFEWGRVVIVALLVLTLVAMASIGLGLVFLLKARKIKQAKRRYHRFFAYVLWLPLLAWSASGFYHLLQSSFIESASGLRLAEPLFIKQPISRDGSWLSELSDKKLNNVSVVQLENTLFYRVSVSPISKGDTKGKPSRSKRFRGISTEKKSLYVNVSSGYVDERMSDATFARTLAISFADLPEEKVASVSLVTKFGPKYDFRNKRLPVWQISFDDAQGSNLFIDPSMGLLVDQSRRVDRIERWSFSNLHKWSFATPFTGRFWRDVLILTTLSLLLFISVLGALILLSKKTGRSATGSA